LNAPIKKGEVLAGKYRIDRVLGTGGMGIVVAATHLKLDQRVAIKFLLPEALKKPEAVERFTREARAAVQIQSEHVARVIDVGEFEGGAPYIVMEYLEGYDMATLLEQGGPLPIGEVIDAVLQACEAIAEAHALGIVHRDLKPANLFRTQRADGSPIVKVLDFGISKALRPGAPPLTRSSATIGSPLYMSPEQIRSSRDVDARTDIWALGVILYQLLAGRPPYQGDNAAELAAKIVEDPPPSLREIRPEIRPSLEAAVFRCLEKSPSKRWENVAELARALADHGMVSAPASADRVERIINAAGLGVTLPADTADASSAVRPRALASTTTSGWMSSTSPLSRARTLLTFVAGGMVFATAAAVIWMSTRPSPTPPAISTPVAAPSDNATAPPPPPQEPAEAVPAAASGDKPVVSSAPSAPPSRAAAPRLRPAPSAATHGPAKPASSDPLDVRLKE